MENDRDRSLQSWEFLTLFLPRPWTDADAVPRPKGARLAKATVPDAFLVGAAGTRPDALVFSADRSCEANETRSLLRGLLPNGARSAVEAHARAAQG